MARLTFEGVKDWAKTLGVKVDRSDMARARYDVWKFDHTIEECQNLSEVVAAVMSMKDEVEG